MHLCIYIYVTTKVSYKEMRSTKQKKKHHPSLIWNHIVFFHLTRPSSTNHLKNQQHSCSVYTDWFIRILTVAYHIPQNNGVVYIVVCNKYHKTHTDFPVINLLKVAIPRQKLHRFYIYRGFELRSRRRPTRHQ